MLEVITVSAISIIFLYIGYIFGMNRKNIYTNIDNNYYCSYDRGEIERKRNISNSKGECDKYFRSRAQMKK